MMPGSKRRILSSFDWFVVAVLLGYVLMVVQAIADGRTQPLPFTPSSQLWYDRVLPPAELPEGAAVSMGPERLGQSALQ
jgi:hypothetical protein